MPAVVAPSFRLLSSSTQLLRSLLCGSIQWGSQQKSDPMMTHLGPRQHQLNPLPLPPLPRQYPLHPLP